MTFSLHLLEFFTQKECKNEKKKKHRMFRAPNLRQSEYFSKQPLVVMFETFRMSAMALLYD